ncbi:FtsK/SpoIIIE family DNA translocase [Latilactobacillus sakei]|uniref:FtsK/SpoIIIE family DNA translocase n=1 Tax=Latilactobacillus sakei TaxID=1599 RepID=UPI000DC64488|nr:DNA translocase FtsK [Latilactobacillus sakei]SPS04398.1 DNA translocase SpoIIIE [Latilactobacillus sakei]
MATQTKKRKKKTTTKKKKTQQPDYTINFVGFLFILISLFSGLKLGFIGALFANVFRLFVGDTFVLGAILFAMLGIYLLIYGKQPPLWQQKTAGFSLAYIGILIWLSAFILHQQAINNHFVAATWRLLFEDFQKMAVTTEVGGGLVGAVIYSGSHFLFAQMGTYIIAVLVTVMGLFIFMDIPFSVVVKSSQCFVHGLFQVGRYTKSGLVKATEKGRNQVSALKEQTQNALSAVDEKTTPTKTAKKPTSEPTGEPEKTGVVVNEPATFKINGPKDLPKPIATHQATNEAEATAETPTEQVPDVAELTHAVEIDADYEMPTPELLTQIPPSDQSAEYEAIEKNQQVLKQTFDSFGVDVTVKSASLGPAVTKYEIQPAVGVKVSKIVNLADDLALALAAKDIRIEAPIPGKPYVGIEVPNTTVSTVSFREMIEQEPPHPGKPLAVPLGKDISGKVIMSDLAKMPHLLIAGSTGSGKSVAINGIITSILMSAQPHEVKLMLIDPKMVELNVYNGIPHLLIPVVTNAKKAANALNKVVKEMERRYQLFADTGQRNMTEYNQYIQGHNEDGEIKGAALPYIVVIVDELSDLMMVASNEVESAIIRLAQMARAAGIHMIVATQRPSVDVITGLIKANIPSRIAFAVSSGIDSRTILDGSGAEKLLGRGDMLYLPIGMSKPLRVQGAFISSQDVESIVSFIKAQKTAEYDEEMIPTAADEHQETADPEDEYYQEAVELVVKQQTASVSMVQRRFRVGYNRAARLIDEMESRGIIGPSEGSKPRKVLLQEVPSEQPPTE